MLLLNHKNYLVRNDQPKSLVSFYSTRSISKRILLHKLLILSMKIEKFLLGRSADCCVMCRAEEGRGERNLNFYTFYSADSCQPPLFAVFQSSQGQGTSAQRQIVGMIDSTAGWWRIPPSHFPFLLTTSRLGTV